MCCDNKTFYDCACTCSRFQRVSDNETYRHTNSGLGYRIGHVSCYDCVPTCVFKQHWVCFQCRIYKKDKAVHFGTNRERLHQTTFRPNKTCPQCRKGLEEVGIDFRPPKKADVRGWARSERIFQELQKKGLKFSYCSNHSKRSLERNFWKAEEWRQRFKDSRNATIEEAQKLVHVKLMEEILLNALSPPNGWLYKEAALSFSAVLEETIPQGASVVAQG